MPWPQQSECDAFYGNPRGRNAAASPSWEAENLTRLKPPFVMTYAGKPITSIRIHKKCAASLERVLNAIWTAAGKSQKVVDDWGASIFGGSYNFRLMRSGTRLSMHSYGCAIDLDPVMNGFHDQTPRFLQFPAVIKAFEDEGWVWGGRWGGHSKDGMHFQAAKV